MDGAGRSRAVGEDAMAALAPEGSLFARLDPVNLTSALLAVTRRAALNPRAASGALWQFAAALTRIGPEAAGRWASRDGAERGQAGTALAKDKRFADPAWRENPAFFAVGQAYLAAAQLADDLRNNNGMPRQVDTRPFELGRNLAATPGKVVFRNDLMELIQYAPQTPRVRAVPALASPPWINKYYIMDLAPGRSFLEWAVQHERTVFAISYRNPDPSMSGVTLDDYLVHGPRTALDVITDITGAPKIDIIGLCLGGALTGMLAAYLAGAGDERLGSVTLLNTLLDYSEPGVLGAFTDELTVSRLERRMAEHGVLEGSQMASTFDALRPNDLIFNYVVSNWLLGQDPPAFDILAWNSDNTRMPAAMHAFYLRSLYLRNELARGVLEVKGQRLSLADVKNDAYVVGAINDHIVPWPASYKTTSLMGGNVRYVLSSGGHIAGIVNPPGPKAWYEVGKPPNPATPEQWRESAAHHGGSWWEDWTRWAARRAGRRTEPPPMGRERYPAIADAPGSYVHG